MNFNKLIKCIVLYGFISLFNNVLAGSYEDFFTAVHRDEVKVVSNLLNKGFDPNTVNLNGEPAILHALKQDSMLTFEVLAKHPKTNVNVRNAHGETPLMLVCIKGDIRLAKLLMSRQADINHPGWTPLHYAASGGHTQIIQLLLDESAYIDAESPNGTTPLMMAARYGNGQSVQLLIDEGADIHHKNQLGLTALDFATQVTRPDAIKMIKEALEKDAAKKGASK